MRTWPALEVQQADSTTRELVQAFLTDFDVAAIDENDADRQVLYFHDPAERDRTRLALAAQFPDVSTCPVDVADEDWATRSQANLRAVRVGALVIAPPWDTENGAIVIQPSMGFGTGHHATTRLCLAALQNIDLHNRTVIDVGTGSGVLAIAARTLGASGVLAVDDDADAITAADENVALNRATRIALEVTDFRTAKIGQFDVVVANLTGGLLIASAERLEAFAVPGGYLVLSGFMDHEERDVLMRFKGCRLERRSAEDEWVCAVLGRGRP